MKRVVVLGSTGSIGRSTLDVIARHPDKLQLLGVASRSRTDVLDEQVRRFSPRLVAIWDETASREFGLRAGGARVTAGADGLLELATHPDADIVVVATSGRDALLPLARAIQAGKRIALASKELLVMAGEILMRLVREHGTTLVPIDSEHAALFQCLQGIDRSHVASLVITGSGGSLWALTPEERQSAPRETVLAHPKWRMGPKITVDSATLMNKGLEVIEARWLFDLPFDRFRVVIHPEAVVHAIVELVDGTSLAQLSACDMRLPIQYALSYPERWASPVVPPRLDAAAAPLRFFDPDPAQFPCLRLALEAAATGGTMCAALNGANDAAVQAYLDGQVELGEIARIIRDTMDQHRPKAHPTLDDVLAVDAWARRTAGERIVQCSLH
jgi:1-deoxy-D-xylulose-5-phosphate reductoisomerase